MPDHDWNDNYAAGDLPWDTGVPDDALVATVEAGSIPAGRTLEIGCGTGTNALWLATRGFNVLGVDVSTLAIDRARAKLNDAALACRFEVRDFLADDAPAGPFEFVFDRGCFHGFGPADIRTQFAARVASLLAPSGLWLSLIGSAEGEFLDWGPPRRSAIEVVSAVEPVLEVLELRSIQFNLHRDASPRAWLCLSRLRAIPAQPSTRS